MFIVVLGGGIDLQGHLPDFVQQRLDKAIGLLKEHPQSKIIVTGKYSFLYHKDKPPLTESDAMADYFIGKGIEDTRILREKESKDSIGNAYYLKINFFLPQKVRSAIIITSHFHLERIKYVFHKIFGPSYRFEFAGIQEKLPINEEKKVVTRQKELLKKTKEVLSVMKTGDHEFLKGKLYKIKYYREKRPAWVTNFVAKGK